MLTHNCWKQLVDACIPQLHYSSETALMHLACQSSWLGTHAPKQECIFLRGCLTWMFVPAASRSSAGGLAIAGTAPMMPTIPEQSWLAMHARVLTGCLKCISERLICEASARSHPQQRRRPGNHGHSPHDAPNPRAWLAGCGSQAQSGCPATRHSLPQLTEGARFYEFPAKAQGDALCHSR